MKSLKKKIKEIFFQEASAHCDIPCGIYSIEPALTAAKTVLKMTQLIKDLQLPNFEDKKEVEKYLNSLSRYVATKEEHAQKVKQELLLLWTDYFKEKDLEKFPNLHDIFWKACKLCSKVKQNVDLSLAEELVKIVEEIGEIFERSREG